MPAIDTAAFLRPLPTARDRVVPHRWTSARKVKEGETTNDLFAFSTTEPNALVGSFHPKALPAILVPQDEIDCWTTGPAAEALMLQRPRSSRNGCGRRPAIRTARCGFPRAPRRETAGVSVRRHQHRHGRSGAQLQWTLTVQERRYLCQRLKAIEQDPFGLAAGLHPGR